MVYTLPAGCSPDNVYYYCGNIHYQPQYDGDGVSYVVVDKPG